MTEETFSSPLPDSDVYAGSKKVTPMSTFHLEVNPNSKTVQLKGNNHSYLVQVSEAGGEGRRVLLGGDLS